MFLRKQNSNFCPPPGGGKTHRWLGDEERPRPATGHSQQGHADGSGQAGGTAGG